uniref:Vacuolar protein sorting-associated protein 54 n=1 Tax=Schistocephalus solidus TaxID=70667 RepID=A0A0X3NY50_SCHSO
MEKAWICEACFSMVSPHSNGLPSPPAIHSHFRSQQELINHIKTHHLSRRIERGSTVFICTYGQSGACSERVNPGFSSPPFSPTNQSIVFDSEYDYEQHLVSRHLINFNQAHLTSQTRRFPTSARHARDWTMYDSVVNMAAVLNDPLDRQLDIFSRDWGEAFERAVVLPLNQAEITERHFRGYLGHLSQRQAQLMPTGDKVSAPSSPPAIDPATIIPSIFLASDFNLADAQTFHRVIPLYPRNSVSQLSQNSSGDNRLPSDSSTTYISQSSAFSNQNERLSQYLDAVELRIIKHVSKQSSAFFEAVRGHDVVREKLGQTLADVRTVREKLGQLDGIYCETAAQMARLERRRANYKKLLKQLQLVASVHSAQPTIQSLLKSNDFCAALDLVSSTQELLSAPDTPSFTCLRHLSAQLTEIARFVQNMVVAEFQAAIQDCLDKKMLLSPSSEAKLSGLALSEDASDLMPSVLGLLRIGHYEFVEILRKEVLGLVRASLQSSVDSLQPKSDPADDTVNGIATAAATTVRTVSTSESELRSTGLASTTEDLQSGGKYSQAVWLQLVHSVCRNLELALGRIRAVVLVIVHSIEQSVGSQLLSSSDSGPVKSVPQEIGEDLIRKILRVYWDAVSWCQTRIINLVSPRARIGLTNTMFNNGPTAPSDAAFENGKTEATERITVSEFVEVAELLDSFQQVVQDAWCFFTAPLAINSHSTGQSAIAVDSTATTTTVVVNLPSQAMRLHGVIANFASGLLHSFHLDRCTKLRLMLDHENWQAAAVPAPVQSLVDVLHQRKVSALSSPSAGLVDTMESKSSPYLTLNRDRYIVVGSVLLLLPLIMDYLRLADQLSQWPSLVRDIQNRLGKLLGVFNSRSCELVLGAGARDLSVLTTISARNLALVCRSLEVILALLPCLTVFFEKLVGAQEKSEEKGEARVLRSRRNFPLESRRRPPGDPFGTVEQAVRTHLSQVMDKLTQLLAGRIASKLNAWRVQPPTPSSQLRAICQAMSKLTETTSDVLSSDMLTVRISCPTVAVSVAIVE